MTIYIHVPKAKRTKLEPSGKKDTLVGYRVFHIEIDSEEQKALKDDHTNPSSSSCLSFRLSVVPTGKMDLPRDVTVTRKRPTWLRDTLQDAVRCSVLCETQSFFSNIESLL